MKIFQNKYRIPSTRLPKWNYGSAALYFITICAHNRECWFGNIADCQMYLSDIGIIVESEWLKTFDLRQDMNLQRGEFIVMPNHFHGIIGIGENRYNMRRDTQCRDAMHCVSTTPTTTTTTDATKKDSTTKYENIFGPQSKNLASIVRGFKSSVTITARKFNPEFQWQSRFYDHIIRNDDSLHSISNYIINNPINWQKDKFYA